MNNRELPLMRPISLEVLALCGTGYIITPNERLRREFSKAYDHQRLLENHQAWPSAPIYSLKQFCRDQVEQEGKWQILSEEHTQALWQKHAQPEAAPAGGLVQNAWQVCHEWDINWQASSFVQDRNSQCFQQWAKAFQNSLLQECAISPAQLVTQAAICLDNLPKTVHFFGFDHIAPSVKKLIEKLINSGCKVSLATPRDGSAKDANRGVQIHTHSNSSIFAAQDDYEEIQVAAAWAKDQLEQSESPVTLGIVVPNLAQQQHKIQHALAGLLKPNQFNISGGVPLVEEAVCDHAGKLLRWCGEIKSAEQALDVINSPFFTLTKTHLLSSTLPDLFDFTIFARTSADPIAANLTTLISEQKREQPLRDWVHDWRRFLHCAGWPGSHLGSRQYQAMAEFEKILNQIQQIPNRVLGENCSWESAMDTLFQAIAAATFSPETTQAPVQVLGYLESLNLQFSALWVMGMADSRWPTAIHRNPMIPFSLQLQAGVTRITPESELDFANSTTHSWQQAAEKVIFSYPQSSDMVEFRPSGLLDELPVIKLDLITRQSRKASSAVTLINRNTDTKAPSVNDQHTLKSANRVLSDQAQCPFRAWAIHQLKLNQEEGPHSFPNFLEWGILVHDALYRLFAPQPKSIESIAGALIAKQFSRFPDAFKQHEQQRLELLLKQWQDFEEASNSTPNNPLREEPVELTLGNTKINLRIDRIDSLTIDTEDAVSFVIDYKTGNVDLPGLLAEPPTEPQLALYTLALDSVQAVCFAKVGQDKPGFVGISNTEIIQLRGLRTPEKAAELSWDALKQRWRTQLSQLMHDYFSGDAKVEPRDTRICERCHIRPICRVQKSEY